MKVKLTEQQFRRVILKEQYSPQEEDTKMEKLYSDILQQKINFLNSSQYLTNAITHWGSEEEAKKNRDKQIKRMKETTVEFVEEMPRSITHGMRPECTYSTSEKKMRVKRGLTNSKMEVCISHEFTHAQDTSPEGGGYFDFNREEWNEEDEQGYDKTSYVPSMFPEFKKYEKLKLDTSRGSMGNQDTAWSGPVDDIISFNRYLIKPAEFRERLNRVKEKMVKANLDYNTMSGEEIAEFIYTIHDADYEEAQQLLSYNNIPKTDYYDLSDDIHSLLHDKKVKKKYHKMGIDTPDQYVLRIWGSRREFRDQPNDPEWNKIRKLHDEKLLKVFNTDFDGNGKPDYKIINYTEKGYDPKFLEMIFKEYADTPSTSNKSIGGVQST